MIKRLSNDCNYSLLLPIFLFYLISVGVQSLAADLDGADVKNVVTKQIVFCVLSLGVMALLYWFYDPAMYAVTGTKRWLRFGGFSFQPSELMKLSFILLMVRLTIVDEMNRKHRTLKTDLRYLGKVLLFSLPTFLLMFMQRDFGTSLVFIAILGALFVWCSLEDTDDDYWNRCGARRRLAGVGI